RARAGEDADELEAPDREIAAQFVPQLLAVEAAEGEREGVPRLDPPGQLQQVDAELLATLVDEVVHEKPRRRLEPGVVPLVHGERVLASLEDRVPVGRGVREAEPIPIGLTRD